MNPFYVITLESSNEGVVHTFLKYVTNDLIRGQLFVDTQNQHYQNAVNKWFSFMSTEYAQWEFLHPSPNKYPSNMVDSNMRELILEWYQLQEKYIDDWRANNFSEDELQYKDILLDEYMWMITEVPTL